MKMKCRTNDICIGYPNIHLVERVSAEKLEKNNFDNKIERFPYDRIKM